MRYTLTGKVLLLGILTIQKLTQLQCSEEANSFHYVYRYVLELLESSSTTFDFILQMQALFCPGQPICGNYHNRSYNSIINEIPSLKLGNNTVEARNISQFVGVCCLPCSCDDSCIEDNRCCLTKLAMDLTTAFSLEEPTVKSECIAATSQAYFTQSNKLSSSYAYHSMITKCFPNEDFHPAKSYSTTVRSCEKPGREHYVIDEMVPVTSLASGRSYWNKFCAICNNDSDDIVSWSARVHVQRPFFYFVDKSFPVGMENFESFFESIVITGEFIYTKPKTVGYFPCTPMHEIPACGNRSLFNESLTYRVMREACSNFSAAVLIPGKVRTISYRNIFCFLCNVRDIIPTHEGNKLDCLFTDLFKGKDPVMTGLLNYRPGRAMGDETKAVTYGDAREHCSCQSIFDKDKKKCVHLFCPPGESFELCDCVPFAYNVEGVPMALKLLVKKISGETLPTTVEVMKTMAFALAKEITNYYKGLQVAIVGIFKDQSTVDETLWCVAKALTVKGLDTKASFKTLADRLEGPPFLKLAFANNVYEISLTNNISMWREENKKLAAKNLFSNATLTSLYQIEFTNTITDGLRYYQELSPVLFCKQVQLNESEFTEKDGIVTITFSSAVHKTVNFYHVTQNQIRICVEDFRKAFPSKASRHALLLDLLIGSLLWHLFV